VTAAEHRLAEAGAADVLDDLARAEQLRERARGLDAVLGERRRALARELEQLTDSGEAARLDADAAALTAELAEVDRQLTEMGPLDDSLARDEAAFAAADPGDAELGTGPASGASSAASAAAEVRGELRTRRAALERATQELRRADERLADLAQRASRLDEAVERERAAAEEAQAAESPLVEELEAAERTRGAAEAALSVAEAERSESAAEAQTWTARADALFLALDQARARAGAERVAEAGEVLGTLLDLVEVDAGWEAAFEAAAGEALSSVVVHDLGTARRALGLLSDHDAAGAVLAVGSSVPPLPPAPPVGERVRAHVRAREPWVGAFLDALVGGVVAVDGGWSAALDAVLAHPGSVVVTRRGDRFGPSGWRVGAGSAGATGAALEEATARAEAAVARLATADGVLRSARADLEQARRVEADLARRLDATDGRFEAATAALTRIQGERRELASQTEAVTAARVELAERLARESARVAELDAVLPDLEAGEAAEAAAARDRELARAARRSAAAALANRRRDLAVRRAGLEERRRFLTRRLDDVAARRLAASHARTLADERADVVTRSLAALTPLLAALAAERAAVDAVHAELAGERRRQSEEARAVAGELDRLRRARHEGEQRLDGLRERARAAELEEAELQVRRETAEDVARRELEVEPDAARDAPAPEVPAGTTPKGHLEALERELRLLGPINPLALEEYTQLEERHHFLEAQLEDVRSTRRELVKVIRAVDEEIRTVFATAFADVAGNFAELFGTLFPGGQGKLVLTVPDDLLNTGIEVEARPSGKNVKKLSLLSGGERSLTALAFLFAVFKARPSPFYVMDEVEAALDDVNLHRFLGLVETFRQQAQLLIVSHQKRTMESADTLYGVSMQPGGSSKVVAERVRHSG
jgi:chromosome segregation protein